MVHTLAGGTDMAFSIPPRTYDRGCNSQPGGARRRELLSVGLAQEKRSKTVRVQPEDPGLRHCFTTLHALKSAARYRCTCSVPNRRAAIVTRSESVHATP